MMRRMVSLMLMAAALPVLAAEPHVVVREGKPVPVEGNRQAPAPTATKNAVEKGAAEYEEEIRQAEVRAAKTGMPRDAQLLWQAHLNYDLFQMKALVGQVRQRLEKAKRLEADAAKVDALPELPDLENQWRQFQAELRQKKGERDRLFARAAELDGVEKERLSLLEPAIERLTEAVQLAEEALRKYPEFRQKAHERGEELRRLAARQRGVAELSEAEASVAAARASVSLVNLLGATNDVMYDHVLPEVNVAVADKRRGRK